MSEKPKTYKLSKGQSLGLPVGVELKLPITVKLETSWCGGRSHGAIGSLCENVSPSEAQSRGHLVLDQSKSRESGL